MTTSVQILKREELAPAPFGCERPERSEFEAAFRTIVRRRGVHKPDAELVTSRVLGCFRDNPLTRQEFLAVAG